jgi:uncharacterized protein YbaP (TraB family)
MILSTLKRAALAVLIVLTRAAWAEPPKVPTVDVYSKAGRHSVIVGSIHVGMAGLLQPDRSVLLDGARRLVIEHRSERPPTREVEDGRAAWAKRLSASEVDTLIKRAACAGLSRKDALELLNLKSVQFANQAAYTVCGTVGAVQSRDGWLDGYWSANSKRPKDVLEDDGWVERQRLRVLDDGFEGLRWILARDPQSVLQAVIDDLNRGDYDSLARHVKESFGDSQAAQRFIDVMVLERNAHWLPRLERYVDEGDAVIVVGAMHLPGPGGLISLLRARGYVVREGWIASAP